MNHPEVAPTPRSRSASAAGLLRNLALGSGAGLVTAYLAVNFGTILRLETQFLRDVGNALRSPDSPIMAGHPVVVPLVIVAILVFCVISALLIEVQYAKAQQAWVTFYRTVTTCTWLSSGFLGFLKCVLTSSLELISLLVTWIIVVLMGIVLLLNSLAVVVIFLR